MKSYEEFAHGLRSFEQIAESDDYDFDRPDLYPRGTSFKKWTCSGLSALHSELVDKYIEEVRDDANNGCSPTFPDGPPGAFALRSMPVTYDLYMTVMDSYVHDFFMNDHIFWVLLSL